MGKLNPSLNPLFPNAILRNLTILKKKKRLEIKDAATQPADHPLLCLFFLGVIFFLFTFPCGVLPPLNSSSPSFSSSWVVAGLKFVKLNSMIHCLVFHSDADSGVHSFIHLVTPRSFIELRLRPAPGATPHTEDTQVMVWMFRVLIVWWRRQSPKKAVSS